MKRCFDVFSSLLAVILFLPLGIPIAIILKFTGEGYIFYKQQRVGKGGNMFGLLKFATMLKNSPNIGDGLLTTKNDPRVLKFGKFLRKTKLNEVPQLLNILFGDMSVIGPRPQAKAHFDVFPTHVKKELIKVRPGLSGIGSIVFRDEESLMGNSSKPKDKFYAEDIAPYKGELELWYIKNQSLILDMKLIFLTAWVVLFPHGTLPQRVLKSLPKSKNINSY